MTEYFLKLFPTFTDLMKVEFNRGYVAAVVVMLAIALVLLVLRIVLAILFRVKHCRSVLVERKDGDIVISVDAVENAVKQSTARVSGLSVERVKILSSRKRYWIDIICSYDGREGDLPTLTGKLREQLRQLFNSFFGVGNVEKINFRLQKLSVPESALSGSAPKPAVPNFGLPKIQPVKEEPPKISVPKSTPKSEEKIDTIEVKPASGAIPLAGDDDKL